MKLLSLSVLFPKIYNGCNDEQHEKYIELNALLLDSRINEIYNLVTAGDYANAADAITKLKNELEHTAPHSLKLAWTSLMQMCMSIKTDNINQAITEGIDTLHALAETDTDRKDVEYMSIAASVIYNLAFVHLKLGESKKAERELLKSQKLFEKLAKKDNERFAPALLAAVEASTEIFKSKLKQMNILAHYQVATEMYQGKVSAGVSEAINSLVDSISAEGDIHLQLGNYRDAIKYYTKALRYQKRISASMGMKELKISINLGKALLNVINRHAAGEQLLNSILPLAQQMNATKEVEEIKTLLANNNNFDIMKFWKNLFVAIITIAFSSMIANAQTMIGHRGSIWGVENTTAAFVNGITHAGYNGLECDIRTTADGTFIVNHDASLKRLGGDSTAIENRNAIDVLNEQLCQERDGISYEGHIITLGEFLDICNEFDCIPVIEIKKCWNIYSDNDDPADFCYDGVPALIDLIKSKGLEDKAVIISFMAGVLDNIHQNYPEMHLQFLTEKDWRLSLDFCKERNMDIDVHYKIADAQLVETFHQLGLKVNTWTVDDPAEFKRLQELGVDMVTTNKIIK